MCTIIIILPHASCIMGTVDGHGYNGQHKCAICDACRPCHLILSALKPVFCRIRQICCFYNLLRCLDLQIWQFLCPWQRQNRSLYPCACVWGNNVCTEFGTSSVLAQNCYKAHSFTITVLGTIINTHILCAEMFAMVVYFPHRVQNYWDLLELI